MWHRVDLCEEGRLVGPWAPWPSKACYNKRRGHLKPGQFQFEGRRSSGHPRPGKPGGRRASPEVSLARGLPQNTGLGFPTLALEASGNRANPSTSVSVPRYRSATVPDQPYMALGLVQRNPPERYVCPPKAHRCPANAHADHGHSRMCVRDDRRLSRSVRPPCTSRDSPVPSATRFWL